MDVKGPLDTSYLMEGFYWKEMYDLVQIIGNSNLCYVGTLQIGKKKVCIS